MKYVKLLLVLAVAGLCSSAWATKHFCSNVQGQIIQTEEPCESSNAATTQTAKKTYTDLPSANGSASTFDSTYELRGRFREYLSPRCRQLYDSGMSLRDSINSGLSRSVNEFQNLQRNYILECAVEDGQARQKLTTTIRDTQMGRIQDARQKAEADAAQSRQDDQTRQQCAESRRIIANKKARTDLTPGEQNDLARFEATVKQRCQGVN